MGLMGHMGLMGPMGLMGLVGLHSLTGGRWNEGVSVGRHALVVSVGTRYCEMIAL